MAFGPTKSALCSISTFFFDNLDIYVILRKGATTKHHPVDRWGCMLNSCSHHFRHFLTKSFPPHLAHATLKWELLNFPGSEGLYRACCCVFGLMDWTGSLMHRLKTLLGCLRANTYRCFSFWLWEVDIHNVNYHYNSWTDWWRRFSLKNINKHW